MPDYKAITKRLDDLADQITDVLLEEADPTNWAGHGIPAAYLDKQQRGDKFWDKKNATATAALLMKIHNIIGLTEDAAAGRSRRDGARQDLADFADDLKRTEREAAKILTRIQKH